MMEFVEAFIYESGMVETSDKMDEIFEALIRQIPINAVNT